MEIFEQLREDKLILRPTGWLDSTNSQEFGQQLNAKAESGVEHLVLDFTDLEYISSAGLRTLLEAARIIKARNAKLSLCALNTQVWEVFDISGFSTIFSIHTSADAIS
ncbi:MAG: STAS domain-containing protein [Xanthomonadales bacterium]|nr:STAS domain-containing protein [Xanthomonadales bacterium]